MERFELWLDESGDFKDENLKYDYWDPSKVAGVLVNTSDINEKLLYELTEDFSHATDEQKISADDRLRRFEKGKESGYKFVVFQNNTKESIVNSDITYLNIMAEGICEVITKLIASYGNVELTVYYETRKRMEMYGEKSGISKEEYEEKLEEKLQLLLIKQDLRSNIKYKLYYVSKRNSKGDIEQNPEDIKNRKIYMADYISNTYHTRNSKKFNKEQKRIIERLYDKEYIFDIFEDPQKERVNEYIKKGKIGEAIFEIVTYDNINEIKNYIYVLKKKLQDINPSRRSIELEKVNEQFIILVKYFRKNTINNKFIDNYIEFIEQCNDKSKEYNKSLLKIYMVKLEVVNHIGDIKEEEKVIEIIHDLFKNINISENIMDYYYKFAIREAIHYINCFKFKKAEEILNSFIKAKEESLLWLMEACFDLAYCDNNKNNISLKSEQLGKLYGTRLQARIPLVYKDNSILEQALEDSKKAMDNFDSEYDIIRQWQYRSNLYCASGSIKDAMDSLFKSLTNEDWGNRPIEELNNRCISKIEELNINVDNKSINSFNIMHYTRILAMAAIKKESFAMDLIDVFIRSDIYKEYKDNMENKNNIELYPYNVIYWRMGTMLAIKGDHNASEKFYKIAMELSNRGEETLKTIGVAIKLENVAIKGDQKQFIKLKKELVKFIEENKDIKIIDFISDWFNRLDSIKEFDEKAQKIVLNMISQIGY